MILPAVNEQLTLILLIKITMLIHHFKYYSAAILVVYTRSIIELFVFIPI